MDFLNEVERAAVQAFFENEGMRESVKKVLLAALYENGTLKAGIKSDFTRNLALSLVANNREVTNEQLGADLRAMWEGIRLVENAFNKMSEFKKVETKESKPNKAR
jgi:hypothetical protein